MKLKYCGFHIACLKKSLVRSGTVVKELSHVVVFFAQFHVPQTDHMKAEILEEIKTETSNIRVIFATSALGMELMHLVSPG